MKSYFNTIKKPKYIKLCGDGDVIDGPIDVIQDQNLTLEQKRQQGIDAYNTANSAFERARDLYRSIDHNDFDSRSAYRAAKSEAKLDLETARADRIAASKEFGGDEAAAAARKAKVQEFFNTEATMGQSIAANAAIVGVNAIDKLAMGDKNFGAQSEAIDGAVHAASGALMKSGNPYCVCEGTLLFTDKGYKPIEQITYSDKVLGYVNKKAELVDVEHIFEPHLKECVQIETEAGNILRCSTDHPILVSREGRARYVTVGKKKQRRIREFDFVDASTIKVGDHVAEIGEIPLFGNKHVKLAYLVGLLIGDGTYGKGKAPRLFTGDKCTWEYLEANHLGELITQYTDQSRYQSEFRVYQFKGMQNVLKEHGIFGQTKKAKRLPIDLHLWDRESCAALLAGLFDTDGCVSSRKKDSRVIFYQNNFELIQEVKQLLLKFGIHSSICYFKEKKKKIQNREVKSSKGWALSINRKDSIINFYNNIHLNIDYKQSDLYKVYCYKCGIKSRDTSYEYYNLIADKVKRIIPLGYLPVYNLQVGGSHTYIANNVVTHNCMAAAAALEGANFLTKAGGQTVQGFDVDINSSGYGNLGHMESSSSRDFGAMIGLGGIFGQGKLKAKLARRNEKLKQALVAADIAEEQSFQQEARANSIENVIENNKIALNGGLSTSVLAAKSGGRLNRLKYFKKVVKAENGAKLKKVEVSEEASVIPEGALHKNKHNLELDGITAKGIPVITVDNDADTFTEIKQQEDTIVIHAEVEKEEVIFSKELTDFVEDKRKEWHDSNSNDILEEVGKRVTKELLFNTNDNADLIKTLRE